MNGTSTHTDDTDDTEKTEKTEKTDVGRLAESLWFSQSLSD